MKLYMLLPILAVGLVGYIVGWRVGINATLDTPEVIQGFQLRAQIKTWVDECEKSLPRDQHCKVVITTEIKDNE